MIRYAHGGDDWVATSETPRRCAMVVDWLLDARSDPGDEIMCGKPARRCLSRVEGSRGHALGCCDDCFKSMLGDGGFTEAELDELYPLVQP